MSSENREYVIGRPLVFERQAAEKNKRSATGRDLEVMDRHLSRAVHRSIRAADRGMAAYRKAQKRSAGRRRNGALEDLPPNMLRGSSVALREMSLVPYDLWRAAYTPQARRLTRRTVRYLVKTADDVLDE